MDLFIKLYAATVVSFLVLDGLWLGVVAASFYKKHLGYLMADTVNWYAVLFFYAIYAAGLVLLVIQPSLAKPLLMAFAFGAVAGLMAYGAYDLTNQATIKDWPFVVTLVDLAWGSFASGVVSAAVVYIARMFYL